MCSPVNNSPYRVTKYPGYASKLWKLNTVLSTCSFVRSMWALLGCFWGLHSRCGIYSNPLLRIHVHKANIHGSFLSRQFFKRTCCSFFVCVLSGETSSTSDFNVKRIKFPQHKTLREFSLQQPTLVFDVQWNNKPTTILAKVLHQGHNVLK